MGTKRQLAPLVSDTISACQQGPLLDLFSGMCAVGSEIATERQVWSNDAQLFAANVAKAFFTSTDLPLMFDKAVELLRPHFIENQTRLFSIYAEFIEAEKATLNESESEALISICQKILSHRAFPEFKNGTFYSPYCLFSEIYAGGYFSLMQSIDIDSIRYAADCVLREGRMSVEHHRWILLALAQSMSKVANTTGHFAQYIKIKESNLKRCINQKKRCVWTEWLTSYDFIQPIGGRNWRKRNRVFNSCSLVLLDALQDQQEKPSVIYADPPYTGDQYSRYYHLYETLFLYDYPEVTGVGQYRSGRFSSNFSLKSEVNRAMTQLISGSYQLNCDLVLSYPDNGLLPGAKESLLELLKMYYPYVEIAHEINHKHSSLGGSKGQQKYNVQELLFVAKVRKANVI